MTDRVVYSNEYATIIRISMQELKPLCIPLAAVIWYVPLFSSHDSSSILNSQELEVTYQELKGDTVVYQPGW